MTAGTNLLLGLGALMLVLAACSDDTGGDTSPPPSSTTTTAAPGTTVPATTEPETTVPDATSSTTTSTVPVPVDHDVFVTVDETLIGWWDGSAWIVPPVEGVPVPSMEGAVMRSVESLPDLVAGSPENACAELAQSYWQVEGMNGVRASGSHDPIPRPYEEIGAAPAHVDAVRAVLDAEGLDPAVPVEISRVIRVDVEGDGVDEVFIEALNMPDPPILGAIEEGHYSILIMRRVLPDDSVENITLHVSVADLELSGQYVNLMTLEEPVDVNGDGTFEFVARWSYYEGGGVSLFELGAEPAEVLVAGCGS